VVLKTTMRRYLHVRIVICSALLAAVPAWAQNDGAALAAYQQKLTQYEQIHGAFERIDNAYWDSVAAKRRIRNAKRRTHETIALADYVLTQPPVYSGPPKPVSPLPPPPPPPIPPRPAIPVVDDFVAAAQEHWGFVPEQPASDTEFKRAYAKAARAAGLTQAQIVGVYAFETGGRGQFNSQSGVGTPKPNAHPISAAMGYNQLLSTNTVSLFGENGHHMLAALESKATTLTGEARVKLERKLTVLRPMIAYCRSLPHSWAKYDEIAKTTPKGWGIHAAVLDIDVGPLLQVQKLLDSVLFARVKGYTKPLTAAELELMNLTGDGNGIDMVTMPQAMREQVPTSNFFQPGGYARNPVAKRTKVVAGLLAEIERHMTDNAGTSGAQELASAY
jgi:hypothetical protein